MQRHPLPFKQIHANTPPPNLVFRKLQFFGHSPFGRSVPAGTPSTKLQLLPFSKEISLSLVTPLVHCPGPAYLLPPPLPALQSRPKLLRTPGRFFLPREPKLDIQAPVRTTVANPPLSDFLPSPTKSLPSNQSGLPMTDEVFFLLSDYSWFQRHDALSAICY